MSIYVGDGLVLTKYNGMPWYVIGCDTGVGLHVMYHGSWEQEVYNWLMRNCKSGDVCVDVGANYGCHTIAMARKVGSDGAVYAFEPNPQIMKCLKMNMAANGVYGIVKYYPNAVGSGSRKEKLHIHEGNQIGGYTLNEVAREDGWVGTIDVECIPLDSVINWPVNVVKIDVEGYEHEVYMGMSKVESMSPGMVLIIELHFEYYDKALNLLNELYKKGYSVMVLGSDGVERNFDMVKPGMSDNIRVIARKKRSNKA